ncbi:MAG: bifunctional pyr operon transcriptional regulator/uracil phosphoribosyltransferase PyrR [Armatimonadota bacterium]|nr:bifunctional pyr operon transcriptional regulator/uracil phosphoribosyltransferase PyrR [Armatimonadota bacterium]MDR7534503.1 bifunctional pyr operon transcriptional regulator/uracil phosphoribosyltransferase PyrR [Armatimonadota bacterium]MDR7536039.1 bifunctional pyr operon transcriptional regulator/uracil phosphoribosyltransferase PyrR [Armatimonadota bacterium]
MTVRREKARVMDASDMQRALARMAHEILERHRTAEQLVLVGIRTRGVHLAARLAAAIERIEHVQPPVGVLDVTRYRDDRPQGGPAGGTRAAEVPRASASGQTSGALKPPGFPVDARHVVLVDDVLYTGRTARAALDALVDRGRPATVQLAVLIDRGHRELPIRADYVGKNVPTSRREHVAVRLVEEDGRDEVVIQELG